MMPTIAIPIGADLSAYSSGLATATKRMDNLADRAEKAAARITAAFAKVNSGMVGSGAMAGGAVGGRRVSTPPPIPAMPPPIPASAISPVAAATAGAGASRFAGAGEAFAGGGMGALAVGGAATLGFKKSIDAYKELTGALYENLAPATDMTDELRVKAKDTAEALSVELGQSAVDLGKGFYYLLGYGKGADVAITGLGASAKFARAGMMGLEQASMNLVDSQHALGMVSDNAQTNAENATRISDVLSKGSEQYNQKIVQFAEGLARAGSIGHVYSQSIEDITVVLGKFADQGVKAEAGGEKYKQMINALTQAYMKKADVWEKVGVSMFDAAGKTLPVAQMITQFDSLLGKMSDFDKASTIAAMGIQMRAGNPLKMLLGRGAEMTAQTDMLRNNSGGATQRIMDEQLKSPLVQSEIKTQKIMKAMVAIGEQAKPAFEVIKQLAVTMAESFAMIPGPIIRVAAGLGTVIALGGAISFVAKPITAMFMALVAPVKWVAVAFAGMAVKIGALVGITAGWAVALGAVVAGAAALVGYFLVFGRLPKFVSQSVASLKVMFGFINQNMGAIANGVGVMIGLYMSAQVSMWTQIGEKIILLDLAIYASWKDVCNAMVDYIKWVLLDGGIMGVAVKLGANILKGIVSGLTGTAVADAFKSNLKNAENILSAKTMGERFSAIGGFTNPVDMEKMRHAFDGVKGFDKAVTDLKAIWADPKAKLEEKKKNAVVPAQENLGNTPGLLENAAGKSAKSEVAALARGSVEAYTAEAKARQSYEGKMLDVAQKSLTVLNNINKGIANLDLGGMDAGLDEAEGIA